MPQPSPTLYYVPYHLTNKCRKRSYHFSTLKFLNFPSSKFMILAVFAEIKTYVVSKWAMENILCQFRTKRTNFICIATGHMLSYLSSPGSIFGKIWRNSAVKKYFSTGMFERKNSSWVTGGPRYKVIFKNIWNPLGTARVLPALVMKNLFWKWGSAKAAIFDAHPKNA